MQSKKQNETSTSKQTMGKFGFPFDVEKFAAQFPESWQLQDELSEDNIFLIGHDGTQIGASVHQLDTSQDLEEIVKRFASSFEELPLIDSMPTSIGTMLWFFEAGVDFDEERKRMFFVEVQGPEQISVRFICSSQQQDQQIQAELLQAVSSLNWLNRKAPAKAAWKGVSKPSELKKLIKSTLKSKPEVLEDMGLDDDIYDDDEIGLSVHDISTVIELGGEFYPLADAMIRHLLTQEDDEYYPIDADFLCGIAKYYSANCLDDKIFARQLLEDAETKASDTDDYLALSNYYLKQTRNGKKPQKHFLEAESAIASCDDANGLLENELVDAEVFGRVLLHLESNLDNENFFKQWSIYSPVDILSTANRKGFINHQEFINRVRNITTKDNGFLPYLQMAKNLNDLEETELFQLMLERAKANENTQEEKYEIYEFLKDKLKDEALADAYMADHEAELTDPLNSAFQSAEKKEQVDQIIRCTVLAAVGDGQLASEELSDIETGLRGMVNRWIDMQEAVDHYEQTGDLDGALDIFPADMPVINELGSDLAFFGGLPPWLDELWEEISATEEAEELVALAQREAEKITDPYLQKIASFACRYVAEADGEFSDGERAMLYEMSRKWELDLFEADRWAKRYFIPVSTGEEPDRPEQEEEATLNEAVERAADKMMRSAMDGEVDAEEAVKSVIDDFITEFGDEFAAKYGDEDDAEEKCDEKFNGAGEDGRNTYPQICMCIYLATFGDGQITEEEIAAYNAAAEALADLFYGIWDPEDIAFQCRGVVDANFTDYEPIPVNLILEYAQEIAERITDPTLQKLTAFFGRTAAEQGGIDNNEMAVLDVFLGVWGIGWDDVRALEGEF